MSIDSHKDKLALSLQVLPSTLREKLIQTYAALKSASINTEYDAVGLRVGKFAEAMVRALQHILSGSHTPLNQRLGNFVTECDALGQQPKSAGPESLRVIIPRALSFLYTLRNKRDVGHIGGDVDANKIDASTMIRLADWCLCELIRVSHNLPLEEAQALCDAIAERRLPKIWDVAGKKRILDKSLTYREQTLLLLYSQVEIGVPVEDLFEWTEHSHFGSFKRDILSKLHSERLIEWDRDTEIAILSPAGIDHVERKIFSKIGYPAD